MKHHKTVPSFLKISFILFISLVALKVNAQITEIYTDFGGYWKSATTSINSVQPNLSNNVLAFTYSGTTYSTGVNDAILTSHSVTSTSGTFKALPISSIGGTIASGNSTFILMPSSDDGVANGTAMPLPSVRMNDVLTDGTNGLNISSGVTNIPVNASMSFPVSNIVTAAISDSKPDILYSQIAATGGNADSLYFVDASGTRVGNAIGVAWGSVSSLGNHTVDLYTLTNGATCDAAVITGVNATTNLKEIRLTAFKLSEFGITSGNAASVVTLKIKPGGASDPAFVAYNADAFFIATPVITSSPQTQIVCPSTNQTATFSVTATGTGLSYQWRKNGVNISGATSSTYSISNVVAANAGAYDVIVSNSAGSVQSTIAYLNTYITSQPSPATQTIATGNSVTLSVTAYNATAFQWKRDGTDITGATSSSLTISPLTTTNGGSFTVSVINNSNSGCATVLSSAAIVVPSTTLYSKSTTLNSVSNWTVNSDGSSGSSPVDFTRSEHTFIVRSNASTSADLTIAGTFDVKDATTTITAGTTLSAGRIIRSGTTGTIAGSSTSSLAVGSSSLGSSDLYFNLSNQTLKNLTINSGSTVTLRSGLNITAGSTSGTLTVNSNAVFNTSDSLTLKSDANGTAKVGNTAGTISGKVNVERYITAKRAWRMLTAPITNSNTIYASWQNNGVYTVGKGTLITKPNPVSGDGMDAGVNASYSMKTFNVATQSLATVTNTMSASISPTNNGSADNIGYFIFIRGDRNPATVGNPYLTAIPTNSTTLNSFGSLQTGNQVFTASSTAGKLTLIGNPYASPIDFNKITLNNVIKRFYVWDPTLNSIGGFVVLDDIDGDGVYAKSISSSSQTNDIQSGEAFFVQTLSNAASSVTINESSKSSNNNTLVFRPVATQSFSANLYLLNTDSSTNLADAAMEEFSDNYDTAVNWQDASKIGNVNESIGFVRSGKNLAIERRPMIGMNDTLYLKLTNTTARNYQITFMPNDLAQTGLTGFLIDNYSGTSTPVSMKDSTSIGFNIIAGIAASSDPNRFMIVFRPEAPLPVTFESIQATAQQKNIFVKWNVDNESNIKQYAVQHSANGIDFSTINNTIAKDNNSSFNNYEFLDTKIFNGDNYYRIISIDNNGATKYSRIVKASTGNTASAVSVFPNPVTDNKLNLQLNNMPGSVYNIRLISASGQTILDKNLSHADGSEVYTMSLNNNIPKGVYHLQIVNLKNNEKKIIGINIDK